MKIKTNQPLKQLNGEVIPVSETDKRPFMLGAAVANMLMYGKGDKLKLWELGQKFNSQAEVELDKSDLSFVRDVLARDERYPALISGQALSLLM